MTSSDETVARLLSLALSCSLLLSFAFSCSSLSLTVALTSVPVSPLLSTYPLSSLNPLIFLPCSLLFLPCSVSPLLLSIPFSFSLRWSYQVTLRRTSNQIRFPTKRNPNPIRLTPIHRSESKNRNKLSCYFWHHEENAFFDYLIEIASEPLRNVNFRTVRSVNRIFQYTRNG